MDATNNKSPLNNPLLGQWTTPYAAPPFDQIEVAHYLPALESAIAEARQNALAIASNPEPPTFANTVEAIEDSSATLDRVSAVLFNMGECLSTEPLQQVILQAGPLITRYENDLVANADLFARLCTLHEDLEQGRLNLNEEQATLLRERYKYFVRRGALLKGEARHRYEQCTEQLSELTLRFGQNALADTTAFTLHITNPDQLAGLPPTTVAAAADEAERRGRSGWLFTLAAPSYRPFLAYANDRNLREKMWRAYMTIGNHGGPNDNNSTITAIVNLRREVANLLGYPSWCDYVLEERMVRSLSALERFMQDLHDAALPAAWADVDDLAAFAAEAEPGLELQRWDVAYFSEWMARELFSFDAEQLRPYFELERVKGGIFELYNRLYGLTFSLVTDAPVYHPEVKVYRVDDGERFMGLLYLDLHPRQSKRSGAWMTDLRDQRNFNGREERPIVQVVCNFTPPTAETPSLLRFDEVETLMHELGHAMHSLLSDVAYPSLSGTSVKRDFVELPSQLMENWCYEPEFLQLFAYHYQTGEPLPMEWIDRIWDHKNFQSGYLCLRQLNLGMTDLAFHSVTEPFDERPEEVERAAMDELLPTEPGAVTCTNFSHIFGGGYASGYYGYKWAEVLDADIFSRFKEEGIMNRDTATRFRTTILSRGGTRHPADLFRDFMGRDPQQEAFLRRSNLL
ncbi:MAG: M3 family metallopeptidase [Bacteroidales bacterium]|nr:M3 family metallopeptidase [Bacteroidales bacterium]